MYLPNTNVLVTRFFTDAGMGEVTDFMSVAAKPAARPSRLSRQVVRVAKAIRGAFPFAWSAARHSTTRASRTRSRWAPMDVARCFIRRAQQFVLKSSHALAA